MSTTAAAWGIDGTEAEAITGVAGLTVPQLDAALEEIVDALGWRPDADNYGDPDPSAASHDVRVRAFGRAIAWQAAYRADTPAAATDGTTGAVKSESIGDNYSVEYGVGIPDDRATLVARARTLLGRAGWFAPVRSGRTYTLPR